RDRAPACPPKARRGGDRQRTGAAHRRRLRQQFAKERKERNKRGGECREGPRHRNDRLAAEHPFEPGTWIKSRELYLDSAHAETARLRKRYRNRAKCGAPGRRERHEREDVERAWKMQRLRITRDGAQSLRERRADERH